MIVPIRCFSCGFPVSAFYKKFEEEVSKGKKPGKTMDKLGIKRYCCRRMLVTHEEIIDEVAPFKK